MDEYTKKFEYVSSNINKIEIVELDDGKYCLYNPFDLRVAEVDEDCIQLVEKLKHTRDIKIDVELMEFLYRFVKGNNKLGNTWEEIRNNILSTQNKEGYHGIVIFPTYDCNLRCIYCYANGGSNPKYISWDLTKKAIDYVFDNLRKTIDSFVVVYHGGGEPSLNFKLIKKSYLYIKSLANKHGLDVLSQLGTNGVMTSEIASWIGENIDRVTISIDGPPEIHNIQRPTKEGKPSFQKIVDTIGILQSTNTIISARSTITTLNVGRMKDVIDTILDLGIKKIHFETLTLAGRATNLVNVAPPDPHLFVNNFTKFQDYAASKGAELHYSGDRFGTIVPIFCNASGHNFCITPDGFVTACYEVTEPNKNNEIFIYGYYDDNKSSFIIDKNKLGLLKSRTVLNMPKCQNCFAKWHCGGGCMARAMRKNGDIFIPDEDTCIITKGIIKHYIELLLKDKPLPRKELTISIDEIIT